MKGKNSNTLFASVSWDRLVIFSFHENIYFCSKIFQTSAMIIVVFPSGIFPVYLLNTLDMCEDSITWENYFMSVHLYHLFLCFSMYVCNYAINWLYWSIVSLWIWLVLVKVHIIAFLKHVDIWILIYQNLESKCFFHYKFIYLSWQIKKFSKFADF